LIAKTDSAAQGLRLSQKVAGVDC